MLAHTNDAPSQHAKHAPSHPCSSPQELLVTRQPRTFPAAEHVHTVRTPKPPWDPSSHRDWGSSECIPRIRIPFFALLLLLLTVLLDPSSPAVGSRSQPCQWRGVLQRRCQTTGARPGATAAAQQQAQRNLGRGPASHQAEGRHRTTRPQPAAVAWVEGQPRPNSPPHPIPDAAQASSKSKNERRHKKTNNVLPLVGGKAPPRRSPSVRSAAS